MLKKLLSIVLVALALGQPAAARADWVIYGASVQYGGSGGGGGGSGTVTSVTASAPIVAGGTATDPIISANYNSASGIAKLDASSKLAATMIPQAAQGSGIAIDATTGVISLTTTNPLNTIFSASGLGVDVTNNARVQGTLTVAAVSGAVGAGALALGSMTGDWTMPTGAGTYTGASGKALDLETTAAGITIKSNTSGTVLIDSAGAANIGTGAATSVSIGRSGQSTAVNSRLDFAERLHATGLISPTAVTGTQDNYAPTSGGAATIIRQALSGAATLDGLSISQLAGRLFLFCNIDATNSITIANEAAGSTAANRILAPGAVSTHTILPQACGMFYYDGTSSRFRVVHVN